MGEFAVNDIVLVIFPFSNLKGQKLRPALAVAITEFNALILCQITSKPYSSQIAIELKETDFQRGRLPVTSYIRPDKLFTGDPAIIANKIGTISAEKSEQTLQAIRNLFSSQ